LAEEWEALFLFIPLPNIPLPLPAFPENKKTGKKMGAEKFVVFIFLPPSFCLSLFVWSYSHDTGEAGLKRDGAWKRS